MLGDQLFFSPLCQHREVLPLSAVAAETLFSAATGFGGV